MLQECPYCLADIDGGDIPLENGDGRRLFELSAAIRRGDRLAAETLLDRIADELGPEAQEQVQQGRFSRLAQIA